MKLFSSEFVASGHPDRFCDIISNTILDKCLEQDSNSRVAVEALAKDDKVVLGGEITTNANIDVVQIVKDVAGEIGYEFVPKVTNWLGQQSPEIALGTNDDANGAGDQGIMFGYATEDGPEYMPLAWSIARDIIKVLEENKGKEEFEWLKSDMKTQVTIDYSEAVPKIDTIVLSVQTDEYIDYKIAEDRSEILIWKMINEKYSDYVELNRDYKFLFNQTGRFTIGGPIGDAGVTGRKIVVDQYGGYAPVGGGNLNGKDPTKVDRSAAYMARYLAKNIVASGLFSDCTIQLGYCIGVSEPVSLNITTTNICDQDKLDRLSKAIQERYDLSPAGIIKFLNLKEPMYVETAKYGHYGNDYASWEQINENFLEELDIA